MPGSQLFELRRRTFDSPHFRGIEFIESDAKTIINRVPGNFLPFKYTINPYRGCSHACSYCSLGETPILMADGRTKPIAELRVGDEIYGTQRVGNYRRYVTTPVLDHWSTNKQAFRVKLEDGTELVTSGDHRLLSNRGWKYVTGAYGGPLQRPHLTLNNHLLGTGKFPDPPKHEEDYVRGYLCGMIRGDATLGSYEYRRMNGSTTTINCFRLALVDFQALERTRRYLGDVGVPTRLSLFQRATSTTKELRAVRASTSDSVRRIRELIR